MYLLVGNDEKHPRVSHGANPVQILVGSQRLSRGMFGPDEGGAMDLQELNPTFLRSPLPGASVSERSGTPAQTLPGLPVTSRLMEKLKCLPILQIFFIPVNCSS